MKKLILSLLAIGLLSSLHAAEFPPVTRGRMQSVDFICESLYRFFGDDGRGAAILRLHRSRRGARLKLFHADGAGVWREGDPRPTRIDGQPTQTRMKPTRLVASVILHKTARGSSVYRIGEVTSEDPHRDRLILKTGGTIDFAARENSSMRPQNIIDIRASPDASAYRRMVYQEAQHPLYPRCSEGLSRPTDEDSL